MKVSELLAILRDAPPDAEVLSPGADHSYVSTRAFVTTAAFAEEGWEFFEWFGPENASPGEVPVPCVVIE